VYSPDQAAQNPPADDAFNVVNNPQPNQNSADQAQGMEEATRIGLVLLLKNLNVDRWIMVLGRSCMESRLMVSSFGEKVLPPLVSWREFLFQNPGVTSSLSSC
jgi:hypothetical protein